MKFFVHVDVGYDFINKEEKDDIGNVDDKKEFKDGVALLKDGGLFFFETQ